MDELLPRRIEAALGLEPGALRLGRMWRVSGRLSPSDRARLKTWAKGMCSRPDLGVFVYNHWLDRKGPRLYKSQLATVRLTKMGWEASVKGLTTLGATAREAAEKLSAALHTVITLADRYREVRREGKAAESATARAATRPKKRSGAGGSYRSSARGRGRKGLSKARHRPAKRG